MFPRAERLTDKKLFALIGRAGTWQRGRFFSFRWIPSRGNLGQVSVVMSKKVAKHATVRNRTKRRIRAVLQEFRREERYQAIVNNNHLLIVVHRILEDMSPVELQEEVRRLLDGLSKAAQ